MIRKITSEFELLTLRTFAKQLCTASCISAVLIWAQYLALKAEQEGRGF